MRNSNMPASFGSLFSTATALISPAHEAIVQKPLYDAVPRLGLRMPAPSRAARLVTWINRWAARRAHRTKLQMMDDHLLRDIGLTRHEAEQQARKPFWQA